MQRYILSLLAAAGVLAQTPDTAAIHGRIIDQSHAAIARVHVAVRNTRTGLERTADSDASGAFAIGGLPVAGRYDLIGLRSRTSPTRASRM